MLLICLLWAWAEDTPGQKAAAAAFVQNHQTPSGGFARLLPTDGSEAVPSLRATRTAIKALRLLGSEPKDRAAVPRFLRACHDEATGGFADRPGLPPNPISTSVALMILKQELKLPTEPYEARALAFMAEATKDFEELRMVAPGIDAMGVPPPPVAAQWLKMIDEAKNPDGTYGSGPGRARTTALRLMALVRIGGQVDQLENVTELLLAGQRADGGFGGDQAGTSDLESCYRIVRLFHRLKLPVAEPDRLREFIARCRNADGGFGIQPGAPSTLHGTYYATIVRHWLAGGEEHPKSNPGGAVQEPRK